MIMASSNEPDDPTDFKDHIRDEAAKRFIPLKRTHVKCETEQLIREIRALLKINAEIFTRCLDSADHYYTTGHSATFTRSTFDEVRVRQNPLKSNETELITEQQRSLKAFCLKSLCELPAGLNDLFVVKYQAAPYEAFIDYDAFFRTAIVLHDDVLEPFLVKLKQHLESIQVCLGKIESWLLEPKSNIQFLEETFQNKLIIIPTMPLGDDYAYPWQKDMRNFPDSLPREMNTLICQRCNSFFEEHKHNYVREGSGFKFQCPDILGFFKKWDNRPECQVLKCYSEESGKFEKTFTIAKASDQQKLKKFIDFMGS
jgi:hypothetical protein